MAAPRPLVVGVDRTLVSCDLTLETSIAYLKADPRRAFRMLGWLCRGRTHLQRELSRRVPVDVDTLPVNEALRKFAETEAASGRDVFLASAMPWPLGEQLEKRFPFVKGTVEIAVPGNDTANARAMAEALAQRFPQGFDYAGTSNADLEIWRHSGAAILVGASPQAERRAAALAPVFARIPRPPRFRGLVKSLRLHQWAKNLLVFAPLVLGGKLYELDALLATVVAFLAMGLVASSTYILNDIFDVADDRRHWSKRDRPIARGELPASSAAGWSGAGLVTGFALAAAVSWPALAVLLLYVALTLAYSLGLKRLPLIDGLVLATLYTLRLALGVAAAQVPPSPWLFVFSMFLFMSLSLAKRHTELSRAHAARGTTIAGRGYRAEDAPLVLAVGMAAGTAAVVIIILYIIEDAFRQSFYGRTLWLWGFPPLVFLLICRVWLVTARGEMNDDPVRFMLADRASQGVLAVLVACFALAWLG
jgi:4-hydroxybenzoate polyprenyltransferase